MLIWTGKPINSSLRTAITIEVEVNELSTLYCNQEETLYESGVVTPSRRRTRLQERCRQNSRHGHLRDSSFSHARHQLSIHLDTGAAKNGRQFTVSDVAGSLGNENCATLLGFYVFSGEDCTMQCIQGKGRRVHLDSYRRTPGSIFHRWAIVCGSP